MSTVVDERVVEMRFDNKQFQKGVNETISTLDKLKEMLKFKDTSKGLEEVSKAASKLDFKGLGGAVDAVKVKFSALEIAGITALQRITNKAIDTGERLIKSLSVDNISSGWQKFEDTTTSVGTLISQGFDMDTVTEQLDRLNWFTDETSYNFTDMVGNIGKFTATGQSLENSVTAMEGIATWAALSGQNAQKASQAMYQLSQAMSKGALRMDDWKSIQNANMDTKEFRQTALEAAEALNIVKKQANGTYKVLKSGKSYSLNEMFSSDSLTREQWLNTDVMMATFNKYSSAVNDIYQYAEEHGITASEAIEALGGQVDEFGLKAFRAAQEARTWTDVVSSVKDAVGSGWKNTFETIIGNYEQAKSLFTGLANLLYDVFAEGGNSRNAVLEIWSEMGGRMELLNGLANLLNIILTAVDNIKEAFMEVFNPEVAELLESGDENAERNAFVIIADSLATASANFRAFTKSLLQNEGMMSRIKSTAKSIAVVLKTVKTTVSTVFKIAIKLASPVLKVAGKILDVINSVVQGIDELIHPIGILDGIANGLSVVLNAIANAVVFLIKVVGILVEKIKEWAKIVGGALAIAVSFVAGIFINLFNTMKSGVKFIGDKFKALGKVFKNIGNSIKASFTKVTEFFETIKQNNSVENGKNTVLTRIKNVFLLIAAGAALALEKVVEFFRTIGKSIADSKFVNFFRNIFQNIKDSVGEAMDFLAEKTEGTVFEGMFATLADDSMTLSEKVKELSKNLKELFENINWGAIIAGAFAMAIIALIASVTRVNNNLSDLVWNASNAVKSVKNFFVRAAWKNTNLKYIAESIVMVATALGVLALMPQEQLRSAAITLGIVVGALAGAALIMAVIAKTMNDQRTLVAFNGLNKAMFALSASVAVMAIAFKLMNGIDLTDAWKKALLLASFATTIALATRIFAPTSKGSLKMAVTLLAFSLVIKRMADALVTMSTIDVTSLKDSYIELVTLMLGLAVVAAVLGKTGVGSVLSLVAIIFILKKVGPEIGEVADALSNGLGGIAEAIKQFDPAQFAQRMAAIGISIGTLAVLVSVIIALISQAGKGFLKFAIAITIAIGSIMIFAAIINSNKGLAQAVKTATGIFVATAAALTVGFVAMALAARNMDPKTMENINKTLKSITTTIVTLAFTAWLLANLLKEGDGKKAASIAIIFGSMLAGVIGLMVTISKVGSKADPKAGKFLLTFFTGLTTIFASMAVMIAALQDVEDPSVLFGVLTLTFIVLLALIATVGHFVLEVNKKAQQTKKTAGRMATSMLDIVKILVPVIGILAVLGMIFAAAKLLKPAEIENLKVVGIAAIVAIVVMFAMIAAIGVLAKELGGEMLKGALTLLTVTGTFLLIGAAMLGLAMIPWSSITAGLIPMGVAIAAMLIVTALLGVIGMIPIVKDGGKQLLMISGALIAFALSLAVLTNLVDWDALKGNMWKLVGVTFIILGVVLALGLLGKFLGGGLTAIGGVIIAIAAAVAILAASIVIAAIGIKLLAPAIEALGAAVIPLIESGVPGWLTKFALSLTLMSVAGIVAGVALIVLGAGLLLVAAACLVLGVAVLFAGAGLILMAIGILGLAGAFAVLLSVISPESILTFSSSLTVLGNSFISLFGASIISLVTAVALIVLAGALAVFSAAASSGAMFEAIKNMDKLNDRLELFGGKDKAANLVYAAVGLDKYAGSLKGLIKVANKADKASSGLGKFMAKLFGAGKDGGLGMIAGMKEVAPDIRKAAGVYYGLSALEGVSDTTGWASPWPTLFKAGEDGGSGLINGIKSVWKKIKTAFGGAGENAVEGVEESVNADNFKDIAKDALGGLISGADSFDMTKLLGDDISFDTDGEDGLAALFGSDVEESIAGVTKQLDINTEANEANADSVGEVEDAHSKLKDSLKNSISAFDEFDKGTQQNIEKILFNMQSQVTGMQSWANNLTVLAARGMSQGLLEELSNMGPKSYAIVEAMVNATDDQLAQANALYAQQMALPDSTATQLEAGFTYAAEMAGRGWSDALDNYAWVHNNEWGENISNALAAAINAHVPSTVGKATGKSLMTSFDYAMQSIRKDLLKGAKDEVDKLVSQVVQYIDNGNAYEKYKTQIGKAASILGKDVGRYISQGEAEGILSKAYEVRAASMGVSKEAYNAACKELDINSPSRVMAEVGKFFDLGFAKGIENNANGVENAATSISETAYDAVSTAIEMISAVINSDPTMAPRITPVLDLSNIQNGAGSVQSYFNSAQLAANATVSFNNNQRDRDNAIISAIDNMSQQYSQAIMNGIANSEVPISVNVYADQVNDNSLFQRVRAEVKRFQRVNGYNPMFN